MHSTNQGVLVKVKTKYQVTIPPSLRKQLRVGIGDFLEIKKEKGSLVLTPKAVIDKGLAEALQDIKEGRVHGPYTSVRAMMKDLLK